MTNKEMTIKIMNTSGKQNVLNAVQWIAKVTGAKTSPEAFDNFHKFCVNDFDKTIKLGNGSYICKDKTSSVDCANALFTSNAMVNYIKTLS